MLIVQANCLYRGAVHACNKEKSLTLVYLWFLSSCLVLKGHLSDGVITANAKLVELDLSDNAFGPDGVKACVRLLTSQACYSLRTLKLNNNGLGVGGGKVSGHNRSY